MHGGKAPQVQQSARERLASLVDPAVTKLGRLVRQGTGHVALGAVRTVIDCAGLRATEKVQLTMTEKLPATEYVRDLPMAGLERLRALTRAELDGVALNSDEQRELAQLRNAPRTLVMTGHGGVKFVLPDNGRTDPVDLALHVRGDGHRETWPDSDREEG